MKYVYFLIFSFCVIDLAPVYAQNSSLGIFEGHGDVGDPSLKGNALYNPEDQSYVLSGAGNNVWAKEDQFHYLWKKIKGDFIIQATVKFLGPGVAGHRKIGIMLRDKLTTDSRYADGTVHGGEPINTSLQYRAADGDTTGEIVVPSYHPTVIELERSGDTIIFSAANFGQHYKTVRKTLALDEEVYAGLYICSHIDSVMEKALFTNVRLIIPPKKDYRPYRDYIGSLLETIDVQTGLRKVVHTDPASIQGPNWTRDGKYLIFNSSSGLLYNFNMVSGQTKQLNTGPVKNNNNDHALSFDGRQIGLSNTTPGSSTSVIFTIPVTGSDNPKQITSEESGHSYFHSWSPDGKKLIFTGYRNKQFDIWSVDIATKKETQLTNLATLDDGSEYTPDGKWIYFNSVRTGTMKIWRMRPDGTGQEQVTFDEYNDWFPHISPDGKWIVYLSFPKEIDPSSHPWYQKVTLKLMSTSGSVPKIIAYIFGGQGTINVPSWSPDSKKVAFISNTGDTGGW